MCTTNRGASAGPHPQDLAGSWRGRLMSAEPGDVLGSASLEQTRRVNQSCERFESAFRAAVQPRIEDFLAAACLDDRPLLLFELVALEVELRREQGEQPCPDEYETRFPDLAGVIEETLRAAHANSGEPATTVTWRDSQDFEPGIERSGQGGKAADGAGLAPGSALGERIGDYVLL